MADDVVTVRLGTLAYVPILIVRRCPYCDTALEPGTIHMSSSRSPGAWNLDPCVVVRNIAIGDDRLREDEMMFLESAPVVAATECPYCGVPVTSGEIHLTWRKTHTAVFVKDRSMIDDRTREEDVQAMMVRPCLIIRNVVVGSR